VELFGRGAEERFLHAVKRFEAQFGVLLDCKSQARFLQNDYNCDRAPDSDLTREYVAAAAATQFGVMISYLDGGSIVADLYAADTATGPGLPLKFADGQWVKGDFESA
jgi:hypothetical protein